MGEEPGMYDRIKTAQAICGAMVNARYLDTHESLCERCYRKETNDEIARLRTALAEAQRENEELRADRDRVDAIIEFGLDVCLVVPPDNPDSPLWPTVAIDLDSRDAIDRAIREARRGE